LVVNAVSENVDMAAASDARFPGVETVNLQALPLDPRRIRTQARRQAVMVIAGSGAISLLAIYWACHLLF
jgi:hypothetical protein